MSEDHVLHYLYMQLLGEFVATYILILAGCGSEYVNAVSNITVVGVAIAWGTAATAVVYTFAHISGPHLNPAVTISLAIVDRFPWKQVINKDSIRLQQKEHRECCF